MDIVGKAKDFNIVKEAGRVGKAFIKNLTAVVTNNTLEIRLYWAGKGTTGVPRKGIYGPLISVFLRLIPVGFMFYEFVLTFNGLEVNYNHTCLYLSM